MGLWDLYLVFWNRTILPKNFILEISVEDVYRRLLEKPTSWNIYEIKNIRPDKVPEGYLCGENIHEIWHKNLFKYQVIQNNQGLSIEDYIKIYVDCMKINPKVLKFVKNFIEL